MNGITVETKKLVKSAYFEVTVGEEAVTITSARGDYMSFEIALLSELYDVFTTVGRSGDLNEKS